MKDHDVRIRRGNVNVHRDQGIVERFNRSLSERLFKIFKNNTTFFNFPDMFRRYIRHRQCNG